MWNELRKECMSDSSVAQVLGMPPNFQLLIRPGDASHEVRPPRSPVKYDIPWSLGSSYKA
jgi:hypothetical protein